MFRKSFNRVEYRETLFSFNKPIGKTILRSVLRDDV